MKTLIVALSLSLTSCATAPRQTLAERCPPYQEGMNKNDWIMFHSACESIARAEPGSVAIGGPVGRGYGFSGSSSVDIYVH